jgi:uncharacterized protein YcaQ
MPPKSTTPEPVASIPWTSVLGWRMQRQHLETRASMEDTLQVVSDLCGLHAQVTSSADLTLWARIDGHSPGTLERLLWAERSLVKTWAMRGTLHMLPAAEFGEYIALLSHRPDNTMKPAYLRGFGITAEQMTALMQTIPKALDGKPLSRNELGGSVARISGDPSLADHLGHSWGAMLKPNASRGQLVFAQGEGQRVRFTRPEHLIGKWERVEPSEGLKAVLRRFLGTYGPVTRDDVKRWLGIISAPLALKLVQSLGDEVIPVSRSGALRPHRPSAWCRGSTSTWSTPHATGKRSCRRSTRDRFTARKDGYRRYCASAG